MRKMLLGTQIVALVLISVLQVASSDNGPSDTVTPSGVCRGDYAVSGGVCCKAVCEYEFHVRESRGMQYVVNHPSGWQDVYAVGLNGSELSLEPTLFHQEQPHIDQDVLRREVHSLDGVDAPIITINGQFPGPTIEVMEGAQIVVRVKSYLLKETLSIHWHGMHQKSTFYSDGVPLVTQCPILPKQSFTYRFFAEPAGTHWYHSHIGNQKKDGLYGAIVIHKALPVLPYHVLVLADWYHSSSTEMEISNPYKTYDRGSGKFHHKTADRDYSFDGVKLSTYAFTSGLINGKGRYNDNKAPLTEFEVAKDQTYRLHIVGTMVEYAFRLSVDNHTLTVLETDGYSVEPVQVQSVILFGGETYVVEINTNQAVDSYWIRAETLRDGVGPIVEEDGRSKGEALAILRYEGSDASVDAAASSAPLDCTDDKPCMVLNCPWKEFPASRYPNTYCLHLEDLHSLSVSEADKTMLETPDEDIHEIFLNFAFSIGSSVNNHRFISPGSAPIYEKDKTHLEPCSEDCYDTGCRCTNIVNIPANKTIQMVFMSYATVNDFGRNYSSKAHHPIHLHGHSYYVLKQGFGQYDNATDRLNDLNTDIVCENEPCSRQSWSPGMSGAGGMNLVNPPLKDTVLVPAQGYTVVRFRSDNPGMWLLHCHTMFHLVEGMMLLVNESPEQLPPPPKGFPTCSSFDWGDEDFSDYVSSKGTKQEDTYGSICITYMYIVLMTLGVVFLGVAIVLLALCVFHQRKLSMSMKVGDVAKF